MQEILVKIWAQRYCTKIVLQLRGKQHLKAILPAVTIAERQAAGTLLQALALWYQQRLFVVLYVDDRRRCSEALRLYEDIGNGEAKLYYEVALAASEQVLGACLTKQMTDCSGGTQPRAEVLR
jgi:hypothetical protein